MILYKNKVCRELWLNNTNDQQRSQNFQRSDLLTGSGGNLTIKKNHKLYPFVDLVERFASVKTCLWCVGDTGNKLSTPTES